MKTSMPRRARLRATLAAVLLAAGMSGEAQNERESPLVLNPLSITEAGGSATVSMILPVEAPEDFKVLITVRPGPGLSELDYEITQEHDDEEEREALELLFEEGEQRSKGRITIKGIDNSYYSGDRYIVVTAVPEARMLLFFIENGLPLSVRATLEVADNERPPDFEDIVLLGRESISENGGTTALRLGLPIPAPSDMTFMVSAASGQGEAPVRFGGNATLRVARGRTRSNTIEVRAIDDFIVGEDRTITITVTADEETAEVLQDLAQPTRYETELTITEDDEVPEDFSPMSINPEQIPENGGTATISGEIPFRAPDTLTFNLSVKESEDYDASQYALSTPARLRFAAGERASEGDVTLTASDNLAVDGDREVTIVARADRTTTRFLERFSLGATFEATVTVTDDDVSLAEHSPLIVAPDTIAEGGEAAIAALLPFPAPAPFSAEISIERRTNAGDVTIELSENTTLSFTAGALRSSGEVTVRAEDNALITGDAVFAVVATPDPVASAVLAQLGQPTRFEAPLTVTDDDLSFEISPLLLDLEEGGEGAIMLRIGAQPVEPITVSAQDVEGLELVPESITFGATNWEATQALTVRAERDDDAEDAEYILSLTARSEAIGEHALGPVRVSVVDTTTQALVASQSLVELREGQSEAQRLTVRLAAEPQRDVRVRYALAPTASPTSLAIAPEGSVLIARARWREGATLALSAPHDDDALGIERAALVLGAEALPPVSVLVNVTDDDDAHVELSEDTLSLEEGESARYTVSLSSAPREALTVEIGTEAEREGDAGAIEASVRTLRFDATNWDEAQTVELRARRDDDGDSHRVRVVHRASDAAYVGAELSVDVGDADSALSVAPEAPVTIRGEQSAMFTVSAEGASGAFTVRIDAPEALVLSPAATLSFSAAEVDARDRKSIVVSLRESERTLSARALTLTFTPSDSALARVSRGVNVAPALEGEDALAAIVPRPGELSLAGGEEARVALMLSRAPLFDARIALSFEGEHADALRFVAPDTTPARTLTLDFERSGERWSGGTRVTVRALAIARAGNARLVARYADAPFPGAYGEGVSVPIALAEGDAGTLTAPHIEYVAGDTGALIVSWAHDQASPHQGAYRIEWKASEGRDAWEGRPASVADARATRIEGLEANVEYLVRVCALEGGGAARCGDAYPQAVRVLADADDHAFPSEDLSALDLAAVLASIPDDVIDALPEDFAATLPAALRSALPAALADAGARELVEALLAGEVDALGEDTLGELIEAIANALNLAAVLASIPDDVIDALPEDFAATLPAALRSALPAELADAGARELVEALLAGEVDALGEDTLGELIEAIANALDGPRLLALIAPAARALAPASAEIVFARIFVALPDEALDEAMRVFAANARSADSPVLVTARALARARSEARAVALLEAFERLAGEARFERARRGLIAALPLPFRAAFATLGDESTRDAPYDAPRAIRVSAEHGMLTVRFERASRAQRPGERLAALLARPACRARSGHAGAHLVSVSAAPRAQHTSAIHHYVVENAHERVRIETAPIDARAAQGTVLPSHYDVTVRALSERECTNARAQRFLGRESAIVRSERGYAALAAMGEIELEALYRGFIVRFDTLPGAVAYRVEHLEGAEADFSRYVPVRAHIVRAGTDEMRVSARFEGGAHSTHYAHGSVYRVRVVAMSDERAALVTDPDDSYFPLLSTPSAARNVRIGDEARAPKELIDALRGAGALAARESALGALRALDARFDPGREPRTRGLRGWNGFAEDLATLDLGVLGALGVGVERNVATLSMPRVRRELRRTTWAGWLRGEQGTLGAKYRETRYDGEAASLHLGAETTLEGNYARTPITIGFALGYASTQLDHHAEGSERSRFDSTTWLAYPYIGYRTKRFSVYAAVGGGIGTSMFEDARYSQGRGEYDHASAFAAGGASLVLFGSPEEILASVRTRAMASAMGADAEQALGDLDVSVYHASLALDARHERRGARGTLTPRLGVVLRHDGGDGPRGSALEAEASLAYRVPPGFSRRLSFTGEFAAVLLPFGDGERTLRGALSARIAPGRGTRGLFFSISPRFERAERLRPSLLGELGYKFAVGRGALSLRPSLALHYWHEGHETSARWRIARSAYERAALWLEASRRDERGAHARHALRVRLSAPW